MYTLTITCFLIQSVASQMVPQVSYQQMYQSNIPHPQVYQQNVPQAMQYYNPQTILGQIDEPTVRRRSRRNKKSKKRIKHKPNLRTYSSDECSGDISGSSSRSSSDEGCRCSCDQCTQPIQCCVQLCSACPAPGPGILFVPYPYPMLITQKNKNKPKEAEKETTQKNISKEASKEKPNGDSKENDNQNSKENSKEKDRKLRSGKRKKSKKKLTSTADYSIEETTKEKRTTSEESTEITKITTTEATTTQETTTIVVTTPSTTTVTVSLTNATQVSDNSNLTLMDTFTDLYDYPRYKEFVTHSYKDDIDALYREIGRKHSKRSKFNDIIYKSPKKVADSNTKYVMASLRNVKQEWLPKYGIVPIPDNMAAELIMSLNEMKSIQALRDTKGLQTNEATEHKDKHRMKSRKMDRFRPPYVEHLYQRHRRTYK